MPTTYKYFDNDPIILVIHTGTAQPDMAISSRAEVAKFQKAQGRMVHRILDFTGCKVDFSGLVLSMASDQGPGGIDDPNVTTIFVGTTQMVDLGANAFKEQKRYGAVNPVELFTSVDAAVDFARSKVAK